MATQRPSTALSYTMRRDEPTRIEGFSDAVFGFSLTLLAFSLEVPSSVEELRTLAVAQLVPTAAAFALMCSAARGLSMINRPDSAEDGA